MAGVQPTKFINYISQFKKLLVTRNNGIIQQKFKIDSATDDNYYFSIVNSNNRLIDLTGRSFKIYGSIFDSKDQMHILFYSDKCTIEQNGQQMHFKIDTYTSQYMNIVKTNKIIDLTIVQVPSDSQNDNQEQPEIDDITQVILRDTAIAYKRPYIENQTPAEILQKVILTTNVPLTGVFGSGQDINLTIGSNGAAFGTGLTQTGNNQLVIGKYNEVDNTKAFIIGNGENDSDRSNLFTIDYDGNVDLTSGNIVTSGTISAATIVVGGQDFNNIVDNKLDATSTWVNETFETKTASNAAFNALETELGEISAAVSSITIPTNISYFNNDVGYLVQDNLSSYATKSWVQSQGYLTEHQSLSAYATKSWVEGKNYLVSSDLNDYATKQWVNQKGYLVQSDLNGYATQSWVNGQGFAYSSQLGSYALKSEIPTDYIPKSVSSQFAKASDLTAVSAYVSGLPTENTTYTASGVIKINNNNVIYLDGDVGQTYTADNVTLQLSNNNQFSIKSIASKLNQGTNVILTTESDGSVTINAIGGGGGGTGGATYLAGLGLSLSTVSLEDAIYKMYVNQSWLSSFVANQIGDVGKTYYEGDYISINNSNVISVTGLVTPSQIADMATQTWVGQQGFLKSADLNDFATKTYVDNAVSSKLDTITFETISGELTSAINARAYTTDLQYVSGVVDNKVDVSALNDYVLTSAMSAYAESGWVDDNYMKKGDVPTDVYTKSEVDTAIETATSGKADLSSVYTKEEVYTYLETDAKINAATSGKANTADVEAEFAATSGWANETFLKDHQSLSAYYTKDEVNAITGTLEGEITGKVAQSEFNTVSSGLSTAIDSKANSADVYTQTQIDTALALKANATDVYTKDQVDTISSNLHNEITGAVSGMATEEWVEAKGYITSAEIPEEFVTATELATALAPYAISADVDTAIETASGNLQTAIGGVADRVSAIETSGLITADEVDTKIATATTDMATQTYVQGQVSGKVNKSDFDTVTGALSTAIDSKTTSGEVKTQIEAYGYQTANDVANAITGKADTTTLQSVSATLTSQVNGVSERVGTIEADYIKSADMTATSTWINNTFETKANVLTGYNDLTGRINTASTTLTSQISNLQTAINEEFNSTSSWINNTFETISNAQANYNDLTGKISTASATLTSQVNNLSTAMDNKFEATSGWANNTFETIANVQSKYNDLTGRINTASTTLSTDIETVSGKANTNETNIGLISSDLGTLSGELNTTSTFISGKVFALSGQLNTASTTLTSQISDLETATNNQFTATSTWVNNTFETISNVQTKYNDLTGRINTASTTLTSQVSDLSTAMDNKFIATSTYIDSVSSALSSTVWNNFASCTYVKNLSTELSSTVSTYYATKQWVEDKNYTTGYTAGSGLEITNDNVIQLTVNTIPSAVSQLVNDSNFITYADVVDGVEYHAGEGLSLINNTFALTGTVLSGDGTTIAINDNVISVIGGSGGKTYTGGTGIEVDNTNDTISLTATIPSAISDLENDSEFATSAQVSSIVESYGYITGVDFTVGSDQFNSSSVEFDGGDFRYDTGAIFLNNVARPGDIPTVISDLTNDVGYQTAAQVSAIASEYAGTGGITSAQVSSIVEGYGYITGVAFTVGNDYFDSSSIEFDGGDFRYDTGAIFLNNVARPEDIPTNTSDLNNDSGFATSAQVSSIVTGYNYITGITVSYNDEEWTEYTLSGKGISFADDVYFEANESNDIVNVVWKGVLIAGGSESIEMYSKRIDWSGDFRIEDWQGDAYISLANPVPLSTSQLTNDSGYTTSAVVSAIASAYAQGGGGGFEYTSLTPSLLAVDNTNHTLSAATQSGGGVIDVPTDTADLTNSAGYITDSDITNKQRVSTVNGDTITYDPSYEIFKTTYTGGVVTLNAVTALTSQIGNGEVATFEEWITFSSAVTSLSEGTNTLVGEWPSSFDNTKTHVIVRRLYNNNGTITQYVSYAYNF